jgi:tetratricopeptide (TPR) repeat protein
MRDRLVGAVVAILLCLQATPASARTGPHFDEGVRLLKQFEYAEALQSFKDALDWPGNTRKERAAIYLYIGIAQSNLNDYGAAEASFKKALAEDPAIAPPPRTSPKISALFERVRAEARPSPVVVPPPASQPPVEAVTPEPPDTEPRRKSPVNWPAWLTLGAGVAAATTGLAMGILNLSEKSKAEDKTLPFDEAQQHADAASSRGLAANILFGVAGAAAVASGVLFYLGWKRNRDRAVSAAVIPSPSGIAVTLELRR